jgi:hypothetical protein
MSNFGFRPPVLAFRFWGFGSCLATINHGGRPAEDFLEILEQLRLYIQLSLDAMREVRDIVVSGKAEPLGELAQGRLRVSVAQPGRALSNFFCFRPPVIAGER